ncbi:hypothetical protein pb186bvf_007805 [Paramecium bursaria]
MGLCQGKSKAAKSESQRNTGTSANMIQQANLQDRQISISPLKEVKDIKDDSSQPIRQKSYFNIQVLQGSQKAT